MPKRLTLPALCNRKADGAVETPLVCLTAYTAPFAAVLDAHCDLLLVGDSVGMALYGMTSTVGVSVEIMIAHGQAVMRGSERAAVAIDLPFGSYEEGPEQAFRTSARVMAETGAQGVKLEGGAVMAETIAFLTARGVPVIGHVGLQPQSVNALGGYRTRGRNAAEAEAILADAQAVAEAGAALIVIEAVREDVAADVARQSRVPVIGIGASADCDGQILVTEDMAGLFPDFTPAFVRRYGALAGALDAAVAGYAADVRARRFPGDGEVNRVRDDA